MKWYSALSLCYHNQAFSNSSFRALTMSWMLGLSLLIATSTKGGILIRVLVPCVRPMWFGIADPVDESLREQIFSPPIFEAQAPWSMAQLTPHVKSMWWVLSSSRLLRASPQRFLSAFWQGCSNIQVSRSHWWHNQVPTFKHVDIDLGLKKAGVQAIRDRVSTYSEVRWSLREI